MKRLLILVLLVSLGLNVGLAWRLRQASRPADGPWRERGALQARMRPAPGDTQAWRERLDRRFQRMSELLGLDDAQRVAFRRHRERVEGEVRTRMGALEAARESLRGEAERQPPDPAAVTAALAAVSRAEAALDSLVAANLREELDMLRPEQQSRLLKVLPFDRLGDHGRFGPPRDGGPVPGQGRRHGAGSGYRAGGSGE